MRAFLCEIGSLTWNEVLRQETGNKERHRKHHSMEITDICFRGTATAAALISTRCLRTLFRFRLGGEKRL